MVPIQILQTHLEDLKIVNERRATLLHVPVVILIRGFHQNKYSTTYVSNDLIMYDKDPSFYGRIMGSQRID
jgi:hypothetical protein